MDCRHPYCPCLERCPLHDALSLLGGKWKGQILCALSHDGPLRYNALRRRMDGVSNTVLAQALRELEQAGLVDRREYLEVPVRVEYSVTPAGADLIPLLDRLGDWAEKWKIREERA